MSVLSINPKRMPLGSIIAILTLSIVGAFIYTCVVTNNTATLATIDVMVSKDYFNFREETKND